MQLKKASKLTAISFKVDKETEDAIEVIRQHLNEVKEVGAVEVQKSAAMRYAILTVRKQIEEQK